MYTLKPVTERVQKIRARYRDTLPEICTARYRIVTEFYMRNPDIDGILKRAKNFLNLCEKIPVRIDEGDVIVGAQSATYRATALYPENAIRWLLEEVESRYISTRDIDPYILSEEDRYYILSTGDFWLKESMSAKADAYMPSGYLAKHTGNGITMFDQKDNTIQAVGHFCAGYNKVIRMGFSAIKAEADLKIAELEADGLMGRTVEQYNFYRAVSIVSEGVMRLTKRYAAKAAELAASETEPMRKKELNAMADALSWCVEKPSRTFHEALQAMFLYQTCMCLDANMHGISYGRVDQYLGDFYEADVAAGRLTPEYAQELLDLFYLKIAEMNKPWSYGATQANPGYTSGQLMTMGGVRADGTDASNYVTYMMLQSAGRRILHDPPPALRIHKTTPPALWEAAIETSKISGGVPTFENDDMIIPALMGRGLSLSSARNYTLIGCVEPSGCGDEWPACGGTGTESYWNLANALWLAINDGYNPMNGPAAPRCGLPTGYLYEMETFEAVLDAFQRQTDFFVKWHAACINSFEYIAREVLPLPLVSCTIEGCMEKGVDVMYGGAKYNSTGIAGVAIGNVADCLGIIRHLVFDKKICTARELYDALMNNWEGYEELRRYVQNEAPHYGNGIAEIDRYAKYAADVFADAVNACTGPRGRFSAGLYPVTTNVIFGKMTAATPDGRRAGEPLADGISPVQQMDKTGPTSILVSVSSIDQSKYPNGTLFNMKFHPSAMNGEDGILKLTNLIQTYFDMGGMEMQINVVSAETLKEAQQKPDQYKNLIVRVAGFSAYFVELHIDGQNDLIRRTELSI
jgi:formate C-acetyltransferase